MTAQGRKVFIFPALVVTAERKRRKINMVRIGHRNSFNDLVEK